MRPNHASTNTREFFIEKRWSTIEKAASHFASLSLFPFFWVRRFFMKESQQYVKVNNRLLLMAKTFDSIVDWYPFAFLRMNSIYLGICIEMIWFVGYFLFSTMNSKELRNRIWTKSSCYDVLCYSNDFEKTWKFIQRRISDMMIAKDLILWF